MMRPSFLATVGLVLTGGAAMAAGSATPARKGGIAPAPAQKLLSEDEAVVKAVAYLKATDYGEAYADIIGRIRQKQLMSSGSNDCGPIRTPVWAFHVQAKWSGWLYIDAVTGEKECSSLPFLR